MINVMNTPGIFRCAVWGVIVLLDFQFIRAIFWNRRCKLRNASLGSRAASSSEGVRVI